MMKRVWRTIGWMVGVCVVLGVLGGCGFDMVKPGPPHGRTSIFSTIVR